MKKIRILSCISVTTISCTLGSVVVKAGPVRPGLKSVVYKMVGGSQVSPYDLSARQRRLWGSSSSSGANSDDGQLPATPSSPLSRSMSFSSISSDEFRDSSSSTTTGGSGSLRRSLSVSSISSTESSLEKPTMIKSPSTDKSKSPMARSLSLSSISSDEEIPTTTSSTIVTQSTSLSTMVIEGPSTSSGITHSRPSVTTRRHARAEDLKIGESIYKKTSGKYGEKISGAGPRPHLIVNISESKHSSRALDLIVADMSRLSGKEHKVGGNRTYLINKNDPAFSGFNSSFVKLNRVKKITISKTDKVSLLGRVVNDDDMKNIRDRLRFKIKKLS